MVSNLFFDCVTVKTSNFGFLFTEWGKCLSGILQIVGIKYSEMASVAMFFSTYMVSFNRRQK